MLELEQWKEYCSKSANASQVSTAGKSKYCIKQNIFVHFFTVQMTRPKQKTLLHESRTTMSLNNLTNIVPVVTVSFAKLHKHIK